MWRVEHYSNGKLEYTSVWDSRDAAIIMVKELNFTARRMGVNRRALLAY